MIELNTCCDHIHHLQSKPMETLPVRGASPALPPQNKLRCVVVVSPTSYTPTSSCLFLLGLRHHTRNQYRTCNGAVVLHVAFLGCGVCYEGPQQVSHHGASNRASTHNTRRQQQISATCVLKLLRMDDSDRSDSVFVVIHAMLLLWTALASSNTIRHTTGQSDAGPIDITCVTAESCLSRSNSSFTETDTTTVPVNSHDDSFNSTNTIWLVAEEGLAHGSPVTTALQGMMSYLWGANAETYVSQSTTSENTPSAACPVVLQTTEEPMYFHEHAVENETCATTLLRSLFQDETEEEMEQPPREWSVNNIPPWSALHANVVDEMY